MKSPDRIVFRELSMIQKIIADETWLEGERRGTPVSTHDPVVRENVCRVILRIGQQMREIVMQEEPVAESMPTPEVPATRIVAAPTVEVPATCLAEQHHHHEAA